MYSEESRERVRPAQAAPELRAKALFEKNHHIQARPRSIAAHLPPPLQAGAAAVARQAFTDGLSAGSIVAAAAAALAAGAAALFLPARASQPLVEPQVRIRS